MNNKNIWFTGDQHFYHNNIIKYANRPFKNAEEMNQVLIDNWNKLIKSGDVVYVLGDFIMSTDKDHIETIFKALSGTIILIKGDHDKYLIKKFSDKFRSIHSLYEFYTTGDKFSITLCHYKMEVWPKSHYNSAHVYAHSHGRLQSFDKSYDVGVDNNNFKPFHLDEILRIIKKKPDNKGFVKIHEKNELEQLKLPL